VADLSESAPAAPTPSLSEAPALPADLAEIARRVEARVRLLMDHERERWSALDPSLIEPIDALADLVDLGGKRLRPAFCHWGYVTAGGDPSDPRIVDAGAAFELLQAFALIHDDIMDGSATRRGAPAVHRRFSERHQREGWSGESRRFGEGLAILVGDLALVYADQVLPNGPPTMTGLWDELRIELNVGQYLDLVGTVTARFDRPNVHRIARYKSGRYTIERPLQIGATLAGGTDLTDVLGRYGDPLGEAFQLRDDVLGVFGDTARTGKPVGDDLREGKPTLLIAVAHERTTEADRDLLDQVGQPDLTAEAVTLLQDLLVRTGAVDEVEAEITRLAAEAVAALDDVPTSPEARSALEDLAAFVVARDA